MKIALIGYGKMGKAVETIAQARGHEIVLRLDQTNPGDWNAATWSEAEVAIEFTGPDSAPEHLINCFERGMPVVCGSTGWLNQWETIHAACLKKNGTLLYASNFSVGVNLFFALNRYLARILSPHPDYTVSMEEIHHTEKKDAPSGTAITLAEQILREHPSLHTWVNGSADHPHALPIISKRLEGVPGTHAIKYESSIDRIEIVHTAHNRIGFATGAVLAAEFIQGKKGIYSMQDVLGITD